MVLQAGGGVVTGTVLELGVEHASLRPSSLAVCPKTFKGSPPFTPLVPFLGIYPGETIKSAGKDSSARIPFQRYL